MPVTRRKFISTASTSSLAVLSGSSGTAETAKRITKAQSTGKLLKIGVLTCHPSHHHMPNAWAQMINCKPHKNGFIHTRMTGMVLSHMWDNDPQRVRTFCEEFGTKPVKRYDGMIDRVDGVIISDIRNGDYFPELSEPYLKAGIPVLFNRPFTTSVGRAKKIIEMSKKYGTPFITISSYEYVKEVHAMRRKIEEWGPGIKAVTAFNFSREITHDVHGLWLMMAMIGVGIESVSVARSVSSVFESGVDAWTIKFRKRGDNPPFYATLHNTSDHDSNAWVKVILDRGTFEQNLWYLKSGEGEQHSQQRYEHYLTPPMLEFQRIIERGTMSQSYEHILEKTTVFLAGLKSHLELGGRVVKLAELEDDFTVRADPKPVTYPDGFFG
ncbi:Gfo/Idh/MocA family oxidoreductase [Candidatus Latescibacterota bacterium]